MTTTIKISEGMRERLVKSKVHPRETFEQVLDRYVPRYEELRKK